MIGIFLICAIRYITAHFKNENMTFEEFFYFVLLMITIPIIILLLYGQSDFLKESKAINILNYILIRL
jgi:cell division protein FtsL